MAHFRGTLDGNRGPASRLGSKKSGLDITANGWNVGCRVILRHIDGVDSVTIYRTGGSNGRTTETLIADYTEESESSNE